MIAEIRYDKLRTAIANVNKHEHIFHSCGWNRQKTIESWVYIPTCSACRVRMRYMERENIKPNTALLHYISGKTLSSRKPSLSEYDMY